MGDAASKVQRITGETLREIGILIGVFSVLDAFFLMQGEASSLVPYERIFQGVAVLEGVALVFIVVGIWLEVDL